ncbi:MAG: hypothetical protein KTR22_05750 [Flavobacteriaceae bacterium]|nr:hypothetical protein [Flavobacteriaceae bacterium]
MKKVITLCIFLLTGTLMWGQSINKTDEEVQKLLAKSWQMEVVMENGNSIESTRGVKDLGFTFREDHTFDFYENGTKAGVGLWRLVVEENLVALAMNQSVTLVITSIQKDQFIAMSPDQLRNDGSASKMEVIFKLKE